VCEREFGKLCNLPTRNQGFVAMLAVPTGVIPLLINKKFTAVR
jgi:hypothetical protein